MYKKILKFGAITVVIFLASVHRCNSAPLYLSSEFFENETKESENAILWRSNSKNNAQLNQAVESLYLSLFNIGLLPTKVVIYDQKEHGSISKLLLDNEIRHGYWTDTFDNIICDLNSLYCERPREFAEISSVNNIQDHIGGRKITNRELTKWGNREGINGKEIRVPNVNFSETTDFRVFEFYGPNQTFWKLVQENSNTCKFEDHPSKVSCFRITIPYNITKWLRNARRTEKTELSLNELRELEEYLGRLKRLEREISREELNKLTNSANLFYKKHGYDYGKYSKSILLPTNQLAYRFSTNTSEYLSIPNGSRLYTDYVPVRFDELDPKNLPTDLNSDFSPPSPIGIELDNAFISPTLEDGQLTNSDQDNSITSGSSNDIPAGIAIGVDIDQITAHQERIFRSINHINNEPKANDLKQLDAFIGVIDEKFSQKFCEFTGNECIIGNFLGPGTPAKGEHGNAVASVAVAHSENGGMVGIAPGLTVKSIPTSTHTSALQITNSIKTLTSEMGYQRPIWNLSWHVRVKGEESGQDLWLLIAERDADFYEDIFVAASGNIPQYKMKKYLISKAKNPDFCYLFPACLSSEFHSNLIKVGAFKEKNGKKVVWESGKNDNDLISFYNKKYVDIAASAEAIVPTLYRNRHDHLLTEGTSFATAQVSALVARLIKEDKRLSSADIRRRIIACGQQSSVFFEKFKGGALDIECTLDLKNDRLKIKRNDSVVSGRIRRLFGKEVTADSFFLTEEKPVLVKELPGASRLYHYSILDDGSTFFLYRDEKKEDPNVNNLKTKRMSKWSSSLIVEFVYPNGKVDCIPLTEISDIVFSHRSARLTKLERNTLNADCREEDAKT